ncbi:tRNA epoxyqueuosine(34) reductase QueG [Pleomorphomonas diazotrophica]|uniref:Epoxyqueuosine reductase n=1 Tax=Pleomorphomonas diazotrophica TaxID=1166257 RepID=A0A1I4SQC4_9HYPH|nr:tRNA epoxyqueuosine(34) reductase QueG [Pleomorphomonas diazotrophica]PKR88450.1 tRNA epoxyqueuosine(34) reductase QueG [Pleomorphomonas diazotrophica]SFM66503.1 epoxyqueuosine reductase [Pleomorphomonas diazotrophica]
MSWQARAHDLGFSAIGIAPVDRLGEAARRLRAFVDLGRHGSMAWMEETLDRRADPRVLWPEARSAVVLALNYGPDRDPLENLAKPDIGNISVYARHRDYHEVIKGRLKEVASLLARETGADVKVFVDTAPLMEKPLAALAGVGWQGKHTNLVSRDFGSWLFLGVILSAADLPPDESAADRCGACRRCLDACPTGAFPAPYQIDARRCISYLTIEHAGPIPEALRPLMGNRIYGCDDCLAVCPWNKFASAAAEMKLQARPDLTAPSLAALAALDDAAFRVLFAGSPVKRIGRNRFVRNVAIAIGNSDDPTLAPALAPLLGDPDPVVADAARWAADRLVPPERESFGVSISPHP